MHFVYLRRNCIYMLGKEGRKLVVQEMSKIIEMENFL